MTPRSDSIAGERLAAEIASQLAPPVAVIAVGSELRGDDAFGMEVARRLKAAGGTGGAPTGDAKRRGAFELFEGGVCPENLAERVALGSPRTVLILDAARFGGKVGDLRLIEPDDLGWSFAGTHAASLELLSRYLAGRCGARTCVLAAQAGSTGLGGDISPEMLDAAGRAAAILESAFSALGDHT